MSDEGSQLATDQIAAASIAAPSKQPVRRGFLRRAVLYPDGYAWYVLASALDIIVTVTVLKYLGFREVNSFAQKSIDYFGTWGLIGLKFLSVIVVVFICEYIGRRNQRTGRKLVAVAIVLSLFPVLFAIAQIIWGITRGDLIRTDWPRHDLDVVPSFPHR